MKTKTCIRCGNEKSVELFHKHHRMRDGRLNKCAACVVECVNEWRQKNSGARRDEYMRGLGAKRRARGLKFVRGAGVNQNPETKRLSSLKYQSKRRLQVMGRPVFESELDRLAFCEAKDLCERRHSATGVAWSIDHVVPLNHRIASGLHNAFNLQVVPSSWNSAKGNRHMRRYLGGLSDAT